MIRYFTEYQHFFISGIRKRAFCISLSDTHSFNLSVWHSVNSVTQTLTQLLSQSGSQWDKSRQSDSVNQTRT